MKWTRYRRSFYGSAEGQNVFRVGLGSEVENPDGRYWAASRADGTMVMSSDLHLPDEGICRFASLKDATWHLEVHDQPAD